ncbi:MAG: hypothetical protein Q9181_008097 [Wetmoreana brouardii]
MGLPTRSVGQVSQQCPFMKLPLELRRMIYHYSLQAYNPAKHHCPPAFVRAVYQGDRRVDQPLPLHLVNKQIFDESHEFMQRLPVILRITGGGIAFNSVGLSACIAQGICGDLSKISDLYVDVWPPHPDRPIEMLYIWQHFRDLRDRLKQYAKLRKINFRFLDNKLSTWTCKGLSGDAGLRHFLPSRVTGADGIRSLYETDLKALLDLLATLTNVDEATMTFPPSYPCSLTNDLLRDHAETVTHTLIGLRPPTKRQTFLENLEWDRLENGLKRDTARIA